jgi:uncharacterized integral membrane protein
MRPASSPAGGGYDQREMSGEGSPQDSHDRKPPAKRDNRELGRRVAWIALAVLVTLFGVLNTEKVEVDWIIGSGHAPLIIVIAVSLLIGIVLTYFAERRARRRR